MDSPRVSIIGSGYVGLITGLVFAKKGFDTVCIDVIPDRVDKINNGISPFFEPRLQELHSECIDTGKIRASLDSVKEIRDSDITFICVGTPSRDDGSADLSYIEQASSDIGEALRSKERYHVVVAKSTIPPGTTEELIIKRIETVSGKKAGKDFGVCMNPEFLKQGSAVHDAFNPDRIVIGEYDTRSGEGLQVLYNDFDCPKMMCDIKAAELIKYAANSFLATKISFANDFARICEAFNVDVYEVMKGIGYDYRINPRFLNAGVGFGGSCFPKDVKAVIALADEIGVETPILDSVIETNEFQPIHFVNIIKRTIGDLNGKKVGFLGLSFKPNTDDVRETRALPIISSLIDEGVLVRAYDPEAMENFARITTLPIDYMPSWREALNGSDFAVIQTDWDEFKNIRGKDFRQYLNSPIVFDGRRSYNPESLIKEGIVYRGIGWKNL